MNLYSVKMLWIAFGISNINMDALFDLFNFELADDGIKTLIYIIFVALVIIITLVRVGIDFVRWCIKMKNKKKLGEGITKQDVEQFLDHVDGHLDEAKEAKENLKDVFDVNKDNLNKKEGE